MALAREARMVWREWEERFGGELVSRDGVIALGAGAGQAAARPAGGGHPGAPGRPARARRAAAAAGALRRPGHPRRGRRRDPHARGDRDADRRPARRLQSSTRSWPCARPPAGGAEVRAGGVVAGHDRVVVCAGRGTPALARGAGQPLPVRQAAHVRLTYARPRASRRTPRLPAWTDPGDAGAYADPLPGNAAFAVGLGEPPRHDDGSVARRRRALPPRPGPHRRLRRPSASPASPRSRSTSATAGSPSCRGAPTRWRSGRPARCSSSPATTCSSTRRCSAARSRRRRSAASSRPTCIRTPNSARRDRPSRPRPAAGARPLRARPGRPRSRTARSSA